MGEFCRCAIKNHGGGSQIPVCILRLQWGFLVWMGVLRFQWEQRWKLEVRYTDEPSDILKRIYDSGRNYAGAVLRFWKYSTNPVGTLRIPMPILGFL